MGKIWAGRDGQGAYNATAGHHCLAAFGVQLPAADSLDGQALINFHQNLTAQTKETKERLDRLRCGVRNAARSCTPAEAEAAATKTLADELGTLDRQPAASVID